MKKVPAILTIVLGILLIVGSYFLLPVLYKKDEKRPKAKKEKKIEMPTVIVGTVKNETIPVTVNTTGNLVAKNRVELFAEVQGVFTESARAFKPGVRYAKGDILLRIRGDENFANLQAQKSTLYNLITTSLPDLKIDYAEGFDEWKDYVEDFSMDDPVEALPEPSTTKEKVFISSRNIYTTYYNVKSLEIRQAKYVIRAPFSGVLTAADITPGTLVRQGQRLGEFISTNVFELEVDVMASLSEYLKVGKKVSIRSITDSNKEWSGTVVRINNKVDRASQTVKVYLQLSGNDLKEGLYLEAMVQAKAEKEVIELPRNLLIDRSSLYIVEEGKLKLVEVEPVYFKDKTAIIRGLTDGSKVVMKALPGAYEGMQVKLLEE